MDLKNSVAILFSGGTDSTLTAALLEKEFQTIHLVTYNRFGFHATDNTAVQAQMLKDKFGQDRFVHTLINVDELFKHISYENYLKNIVKHGFFNLSTCGLCKLSMHVRTIAYCLDNQIYHVADGANQAMSMEPAQIKEVIDEMKRMYQHFGISYFNPVFELDAPGDGDFLEKENLQFLKNISDTTLTQEEFHQKTPGSVLHEMGLAPERNVKGSDYDKKRQPRCFQFIPFNIFAKKYFLASKSYDEYKKQTVDFYTEKINMVIKLLDENKDKKNSKYFK